MTIDLPIFKYFIAYAIKVALMFSPFAYLYPAPTQAITTPLFVSLGQAYIFSG